MSACGNDGWTGAGVVYGDADMKTGGGGGDADEEGNEQAVDGAAVDEKAGLSDSDRWAGAGGVDGDADMKTGDGGGTKESGGGRI